MDEAAAATAAVADDDDDDYDGLTMSLLEASNSATAYTTAAGIVDAPSLPLILPPQSSMTMVATEIM